MTDTHILSQETSTRGSVDTVVIVSTLSIYNIIMLIFSPCSEKQGKVIQFNSVHFSLINFGVQSCSEYKVAMNTNMSREGTRQRAAAKIYFAK